MDKCEDLGLVLDRLVPAMMDPILGDYARNVPDARYARPHSTKSHVFLTTLRTSSCLAKGQVANCQVFGVGCLVFGVG